MPTSQAIFITGATGFVGRRLVGLCARSGRPVRIAVPEAQRIKTTGARHVEQVLVGNVGTETRWESALEGADAVIHLAARVHVTKETAADPAAEFESVNVTRTVRLATAAACSGVKRFVFVSSAKIHGDETETGRRFHEMDEASPPDPYSISKWRAEQSLLRIAHDTGLEVVIVRPPLMYGPGVKANMLALLQLVAKGYPLPFAGAHNLRSLLYVDNLASFLLTCVDAPAAAGETFLVSDCDLSTPELVRQLSAGVGRRSRLINVPDWLMRKACAAMGRSGIYTRLFGSLLVDSGKARRLLGWAPPFAPEEGFVSTARWFASCREEY